MHCKCRCLHKPCTHLTSVPSSPPLPHISPLALPQNSSQPNRTLCDPSRKAGEQYCLFSFILSSHLSHASLPWLSFQTRPMPTLLSPTTPSKQENSMPSLPPSHFPQHLLRSVSGPEGEVKLHPRGSFREAEGQQVLLGDDMATGELSDCRLRNSEREKQLFLEFRHLG